MRLDPPIPLETIDRTAGCRPDVKQQQDPHHKHYLVPIDKNQFKLKVNFGKRRQKYHLSLWELWE